MRASFRIRTLFTVLLALSAPLAQGCGSKGEAKAELKPEPKLTAPAQAVTLMSAPKTLQLTGTLRGARETDLAANVNGRVSRVLIERGMDVEKGAVIAEVDVTAANLALAEARVQVATSQTQEAINRADCDRYTKLKEQGAATDLEYDQITAKCKTAPLGVEAAVAREKIAAKNVGDGAIRAPFAGVVADHFIEAGEYVQSSSKVATIAQVDELKLEFSVPEMHWPAVKKDADVALRVAAYPDRVFHGKVSHIAGAARDTRDVLVEARVPNAERALLPGMFAYVELMVGERSLPSVPKNAVFQENGKANVLVVKDGQLEQRVLQLVRAEGERVPVLKGVSEGERVVSPYESRFKNGQAVH